MKDNFHAFGVACQRFIHTVINNFLTKMVDEWCRYTCPDGGAPVSAGEYLNGISII